MCESMTLKITTDIHHGLQRAGSIPIVGVIPSVLQVVVSVVQAVVALVFATLLAPILLMVQCCPNIKEFINKEWVVSVGHVCEGTSFLIYSLGNIITFGFFGFFDSCAKA